MTCLLERAATVAFVLALSASSLGCSDLTRPNEIKITKEVPRIAMPAAPGLPGAAAGAAAAGAKPMGAPPASPGG